jgi:hypothetical protein
MDKVTNLIVRFRSNCNPDRNEHGAYILSFTFADAITTIRIVLDDYSGADLVITNMTTLPDNAKSRGYGSTALQEIVSWASEQNLKDVRAVQVQRQSECFWLKNNFARMPEPNQCNDYQLQNRNC